MRKFLFLDIDGVICLGNGLDRNAIKHVKELISLVPDIEVVLTSTRRTANGVEESIANVLGVIKVMSTPTLRTDLKSLEVAEFLRQNCADEAQFVIVDDKAFLYADYTDNLVVCNKYRGFGITELERSLVILQADSKINV